MKILIIPSIIESKTAAPTRRLRSLVHFLSKDNEVYIAVQKEYGVKGKNVVNIGSYTNRPFIALQMFFSYFKWLSKVDVIYCRHGVNGFFAVASSKISGKPLVTEAHSLFHLESADNLFYRFLDWFVLSNSRAVVTVSTLAAKAIKKKYDVKTKSIPNGADMSFFKPQSVSKCRKELGLNSKTKYATFIGRVEYWQGAGLIVEAAKKLKRVEFLFVGGGNGLEELKQKVKDEKINNVKFIGKVSQAKVPKYINASDVLLAPFAKNKRNAILGFSALKVVESLACGSKVITTKYADMDKEVKMCDGAIIKSGDTKGLVRAIKSLAKKKKNSKSYKFIKKNHSWKSVVKRIEEFLLATVKQ